MAIVYSIDEELDQISYEWLIQNHPALLHAMTKDINAGRQPADLRRRVLERTGRYELALRCEQAARWLVRLKAAE